MNAPIVPCPKSFKATGGEVEIAAGSEIGFAGGSGARAAAGLFAEYLQEAGFSPAPQVSEGTARLTLVQTGDPKPDAEGFLPEAYEIEVSAASGIVAKAESAAGLARAVQTLRQLSAVREGGKLALPECRIEDAPAFRWRGLMLDVSRHFFSADDVCRFIELLAQHRMNVFHWHLTDDQGWRVEIKRYPKLAEVGSVRERTISGHHCTWPHVWDDTPHCGFYTQSDIRRVVEFAARRHVAIVPEIDMPGHMEAAIAAYPELGTGVFADVKVRDRWGISQNVLSLDDKCVEFCKGVWEELFDLFPGRFFHIGGDEAPTKAWEESADCQRLMALRGLDEPRKMQSWFTSEMQKFFAAHGRRLIGWDEILEGGVEPSAAVMHWRSHHQNLDIAAAAKAGHKIVRAPTSHTYLDYYQAEPVSEEPLAIGGLLTLPGVWQFDPLAGIPQEAQGAVMGGQAQLWTEYIATRDHLDYMAYPRACAIAESLWCGGAAARKFAEFRVRLAAHLPRLAAQGVKYCRRGV
ncbi:MAG: beta-N-acetylhexosaminidase [Kiritimatiellae bacterium]|nr:beta-N-acetylhexosaminidase [Kiritimatiellia bacterium]